MNYFDGIRSLKRKWFADKLFNVIEAIGVPAKTVIWDGFRFMVSSIDGMKSTKVTAPMGVVAVCGRDNDIAIFSSEYWLSVISRDRAIYATNTSVAVGFARELISTPDVETNVDEVVPSYNASFSNCHPKLFPLKTSEYLFSSLSAVKQSSSVIAESVLGAFLGDNSHRFRKAFFLETDSAYLSRQLIQLVPSNFFRAVRTQVGIYFRIGDTSNVILASIWDANTLSAFSRRYFTSDVSWVGVPAELLDDITPYHPTKTLGLFLGSYAFAPTATNNVRLLNAVTCTQLDPTLASFFVSAGVEIIANRKWRLFYTITEENDDLETAPTVSLVNAEGFIGLLNTKASGNILSGGTSLSDPGVTVDWEMAADMLAQFFPYPNSGFIIPHDSVMFHSPTNVYTWTRNYGAVKFTGTGIEEVTLTIPTEVTGTEGVRPDIFHCGEGLYVCFCNNVGSKIEAVYIGSPFDAWTAVPMPATDLLAVRPVLVNTDRKIFVGVVKYTRVDPQEGEIPVSHKFAVYDSEVDDENWREYAEIPLAYAARNNWDISFYGDGFYTKCMSEFVSPPPVTPQTYKLEPYSSYPIVGA